MSHAVQILRTVEFAVYVLVGVVAALRWLRRRGRSRAWLAATFGLVAVVLLVGELLPREPAPDGYVLARKLLLAALLVFPYLLYRFMATFERPPAWMSRAVHVLVVAAVVSTLLVQRFPRPGEPRSAPFAAYVLLIMVEWSFVSGAVSVRLWRAGRGQPAVARVRMRMLGAGAGAVAAVIVIASLAPASEEASGRTAVTLSIGTVSALLFLCGFAPPRTLVRSWRARDLEALQGALVGLAQATSPDDVVRDLLPRLMRLVGAQGAAIYREDGELVGLTGATPEVRGARVLVAPGVTQVGSDHLSLTVPGGRLELWTTSYTPYFGREEVDLLRNVAVLLQVTLERTLAHAREVAAREALDEAQRVARLGSWRMDVRTGEIEWSDEMFRLYELPPQSIRPTEEYFVERTHPEDRDAVTASARHAMAAGGEFTNEYRISNADGSTRWIQTRGRVEAGADGAPAVMIGTCQDVTEARRLDRMRRDFVANAAHELRTPLTTVSGMATLLATQRARLSPAELDHAFDALGRQGERARELVSSLLDLSRLEAGRVPVQLAPTEVGPVLASALETAPPPVSANVSVDCPPGLVVTADADRLHDVVVNLLSNAYRYGGPDVRIDVRRDGDRVTLAVTDDGNGVPPPFVHELFQPFSRAAGVTGTPGSGLGLAISQRLMAALGGSLTYEPARPRGARFVASLGVAR